MNVIRYLYNYLYVTSLKILSDNSKLVNMYLSLLLDLDALFIMQSNIA